MKRREVLKALCAVPFAAVVPAATCADVAEAPFAFDIGVSESVTLVNVCEMRCDGLWRVIATKEYVSGNDIDAFMDKVKSDLIAARAA